MQNGKSEVVNEGINDEQNTTEVRKLTKRKRHANEQATKKPNETQKQTNLT